MRYDYPDRAPFPGLTRMQTRRPARGKIDRRMAVVDVPGPRHARDRRVGRRRTASSTTSSSIANAAVTRTRATRAGSKRNRCGSRQSARASAPRRTSGSVPKPTGTDRLSTIGSRRSTAKRPKAQRSTRCSRGSIYRADKRPGLIMAYWHGADTIGHRRGPDSTRIVEQIYEQDAQLVRLLDGIDARRLWDDTTVILVSDHGMTALHGFFDLAGFSTEHGYSRARLRGPGIRARLPGRSDAGRWRLCVAVGDTNRSRSIADTICRNASI